MLFVGIRTTMNRDEGMASFLMNMLVRVLMNVSVGIVSGVVSFLFNVYSVIRMFGPNIFVGLLFFACCFIASAAFLVTSVSVLVGGTVLVGAGAVNMAIAAGEQQRREAQRLHGAAPGRAHAD